ncbi:MAG: tRNA uridine-5-carboxymethylaminomethyl(34) synthesis enzyme MnmG [Phycisphaerae bacterium]|nr:tRNA uridine-5-carboxymethylaminomethyl(34) synthesis enzyme MnmG [Phycisphaerae bacterium]
MDNRVDVIVIGGGHAGVEAAWAASSALPKGKIAFVTMDASTIGVMSCNPAIGGLGKGQIVREIDALGGVMARAIDATGIMFKMLNTSKGPAVWGPRAQADKDAYRDEVQRMIATRNNIEIIEATVEELIVEDGVLQGVMLDGPLYAKAVVLTTGTFMRGLMHTGDEQSKGGRVGEGTADTISSALTSLGFELGRLKTGTPARLSKKSIDWDNLPSQLGDAEPVPFSDLPPKTFPVLSQVDCRITATTPEMHQLIKDNLDRAPMYSGAIDAESGPRYCPSIEDKVVRFAERESHHVFLEPETVDGDSVYCNGISTSLPSDIQEQIIPMMAGCKDAIILQMGYAVEYDIVRPHQINATCETKLVQGLFLAGQINGTSGYEEAAGQGLLAGLNAARKVNGEDEVTLGRDQAYIGVMMDDLVTTLPREPYRMFTSRAEHRLLLRADNSDERLTPFGRELGIVCDERWEVWEQRKQEIYTIKTEIEKRKLSQLAKRSDTTIKELQAKLSEFDSRLVHRVVSDIRYAGYIVRQQAEIKRQAKTEGRKIPTDLNPSEISGLRNEAVDVLKEFKPATLGQASRLAGITPADITLISIAIGRFNSTI